MARPFYDKLDWTVVVCGILLATISLLTIYSVSSSSGTGKQELIYRQSGWFVLSFLVIVLLTSIDYHIISGLAYPIYGSVVIALVLVLMFGEKVSGAIRWFKVGPISFQPSELAKIALILVLSKYFADKKKDTVYLSDFIIAAIFLGIPVALILKEPDLGMSILLFPVFVTIVYVAGIDVTPVFRIILFRPVLIVLVVSLLVTSLYKVHIEGFWKLTEQSAAMLGKENIPGELVEKLAKLRNIEYTSAEKFLRDVEEKIGKEPASIYETAILEHAKPKIRLISLPIMMVWLRLKPYQRDRLIAFINPARDPLGTGYHVIQSQIAIGSGGVWGKGYMNGTQSQLKFLPEQFTDFIFSVFSEEWGFVGSCALLSVYLVLILKGLTIATKARDKLGRQIAVGVVTVLVVHMFVNVGVATGIMPVTGLTLPYVSYGGSSVFSTSVALGLLLNVSFRRFEF